MLHLHFPSRINRSHIFCRQVDTDYKKLAASPICPFPGPTPNINLLK